MSQTQLSDETIQKTHTTDLQSIPERSAFRPVLVSRVHYC